MMQSAPYKVPLIFIGYARQDRDAVLRLYDYLQIAHCRPWLDLKNVWPIEIWEDAGRLAAGACDIFLACLSEKSASSRGFLDTELKRAYEIVMKESPSRNVGIIPVRLAACDMPPELEGYTGVSLFEREGFSRLVELIWREWARGTSISETESKVAKRPAPTTFRVVPFADANAIELRAAISLADNIQSTFNFKLHGDSVDISNDELGDYRLANRGFSLQELIRRLLECEDFRELTSEWLVFVTGMPLSDKNLSRKYSGRSVEEDLNQCYFLEDGLYFARNVAILSTYVWDHLPARPGIPEMPPGRRTLKPFLLSQFAKLATNSLVEMRTHEEIRRCPFDYYSHVEDIDFFFDGGRICDPCERVMESALHAGEMSVEQLASVRRLVNLAVGRRECAVLVAPGTDGAGVYSLVEQLLGGKKWAVRSPNMLASPLGILDMMLASDLIIADISAEDPYVLYLVSVAQANDRDFLLLLQDDILFNVRPERIIRYQRSIVGYQRLAKELDRLGGM